MEALDEKSLEFFKNGDFENIWEIEKEMFKESESSLEDWIKKQPYPVSGSGKIILEKIR